MNEEIPIMEDMNFPILHGNWVDLVIIVVIAIYVFEGWERGFIRGCIDMVGFLLSLLVALRFYSFAANLLIINFSLSRGVANALGFFLVATIIEFIFSFFSSYIDMITMRSLFTRNILKWDKIFGFIPALISSLILISFILATFITLPVRPDIKQDIVKSRIGGFLASQTFGVERSLSGILGGAIEDSLVFLTVKPQGHERVDLHFTTNEFTVDDVSERRIFDLVNQEREKSGLAVLAENDPLREVGRAHCKDMLVRGYFSHNTPEGITPFDRMEDAGIEFRDAGENLAFAPAVEIAHTGLMNSPGHRANILSPEFGKVGIGVINGGIYGRMFCQEFTN